MVRMKVLLVGDYPPVRQYSMRRFVELMRKGLQDAGLRVRVARPSPYFGRLWPHQDGIGKWMGYIDRFLIFPLHLKRTIRWADLVHICDQANAVYIPWLKDKPHVLTCHDLIAVRSALGEIAAYRTGITGGVYQRWILRSLRQSKNIVCISRSTADDLARLSGLSRSRVSIAPLPLNYDYRPMEALHARHRLQKLGLDPDAPFLLHVGGDCWYKNREGVLRIFSRLRRFAGCGDHRMVMAGSPLSGTQKRLIADLGIASHVWELPHVGCEDLRALYTMARAMVFPSLLEGFGWPIIEAQACGCPVFTTDRGPMTETGGSAAVYIRPADEQAAAERIARGLSDREQMAAAGFRNAARFSASAMIGKYLQVYESAMRGNSR
jgi:glycosyltransferase involved in cell wall biosynthesis